MQIAVKRMKKTNLTVVFTLCFVFLIFFSVNSSALTLNMKESYQPRETMIIEVAGNILSPIKLEDVEFKRKNVIMPLNYDVKVLGEKMLLATKIIPIKQKVYFNTKNGLLNG